MNSKKILSLILTVILISTVLTSCKSFNGSDADFVLDVHVENLDNNSKSDNINSTSSTPNIPTSKAQEKTTVKSEGTASDSVVATTEITTGQTAEKQDTSEPVEQATQNTSEQSNGNAPSTKEEIVEYYKKAFSLAKTDAKKVIMTYTNTTNQPAICEAGKLSSIASTLMNTFMKESEPNEELSPADLPPKGIMTSPLDASFVREATCKDTGDSYEIYIVLDITQDSPDVNPPAGGGKAGTITDVLESSSVTDAVGSIIKFENLANSYFDTSITAVVEKSTGHLTALETVCPSIMSFDKVSAAIISVEDARLGLTYNNRYSIEW